MSKPLTLFDALQMEAYKARGLAFLIPVLRRARCFVLDDGMSEFLADLGTRAFHELIDAKGLKKTFHRDDAKGSGVTVEGDDAAVEAVAKGIRKIGQGLRVLAKAPHAVTWIEFNFEKRFDRYLNAFSAYADIKDFKKNNRASYERCGWLVEQISDDDYQLTVIMGNAALSDISITPYKIVWTSAEHDHDVRINGRPFIFGDTVAGDEHQDAIVSRLAFGTPALTRLCRFYSNEITALMPEGFVENTMQEMRGELRYVWALLASINDLPVGIRDVKPARGFMARRNYQRFMNYSVITLVLPKRMTPQRLARILVTISRRKAHEVRGHFRRVGPDKKRVWIKEHIRGDATLGWVTHSYKVKHEEPA